MAVKNYSKITSLITFLIVPVHWNMLNIGFNPLSAKSIKWSNTLKQVCLTIFRDWRLKG